MTVTEVQLKGGAGPRQAGVPNWLSGWQGAVLVSTVVTLFTWPGWTRVKPGLDPSWQAGLAIAFTHHLQWGPQLDFTYGPYGFAGYLEPFYRSTALIAVLYVLAVTWLLAFLLVTGLRKYCGLGAAAVIAWAVVWLSWVVGRAADFSLVVGLGLALCIVGSRQPARRAELALLLGALAGFAFLVKLSTGVVLLGLLVAALAGADGPWRERLRTSALAAAVMVGVFTMAWLVAGQTIANLPSFARASVSLVVGYGAAMGGALKDASIAWWALTMALLAAVVFATALRGRPRREQVAVLVLVGGWGWASVKEGFVSGNHFPLFFRVVLAAIALAALAAPPRRLYAGALALAACITLVAIGVPETDPVAGIPSLATDLADLAQPARFALLTGTTRLQLLKDEPVPGSTLALLRGRSVAIEPWEDMVAWADPNLRWDPEPVVQDYSAFTPYLDHLDAHFLSSARAPERILYRPNSFAFDFRDPFMDPPATTEAVYCYYVQLAWQRPWLILGRVPDRCGEAVTIGTAHARFGQPVKVPGAPGKMVVASLTLSSPVLSRLETGLLKPPGTYLVAWADRGRAVHYRFVPGTAPDDHVLSVPSALGYSPPFAPAPVRQFEISGGGWKAGQGSVTVTFRALSVTQ